MMTEAMGRTDSAASNPAAHVESDTWHVALAADDVKVVSLEQLDDLFRLSLVDAETRVWQPGMREWVTLGVVAGLDEEPPAPAKRAHPKPPSPRSAPPPSGELPTRYPFPGSAAFPIRPPVAMPFAPAIASVRPLVETIRPEPASRGGAGLGRFIVGLSLLVGVSVTLYRNGVLREQAHALHQDTLYARLEQALGGPSSGTPSAIEQGSNSVASVTRAVAPTGEQDRHSATNAEVSVALASAVTEPTPTPAETVPSARAPGQLPVVPLESLGTEQPDTVTSPARARAVSPAPTAKPVPNLANTKTSKSLTPARLLQATKTTKTKTTTTTENRAAPSASKPASGPISRERLNAEIQSAMQSRSTQAAASKGAANDYDPLNPKL